MRTTTGLFVLTLAFMAFSLPIACSGGGKAQRRDAMKAAGWTPLGERVVDFGGDRDVIPVTASEGRFRALRVKVKGSPLQMWDVVVTFGNGEKFSPATKLMFAKGDMTRRIDLPGGKRVIRKVAFLYKSVGKKSGRATVRLFGQH